MRTLIRSAVGLLAAAWVASAAAETIEAGGKRRTYTAVLPAEHAAPLVIVLHGNLQQGRSIAERSSWPAVARREHFAVLFPDGLNRAWADFRAPSEKSGRKPPLGTDDVGFIAELIDTMVRQGVADPLRVYITGVSNGAAMTMSLVCARPELFTAAAAVIMTMTNGLAAACKPGRAMPMLIMDGTADPLIPYGGGKGTSRFAAPGFWSARDTIAFWRRRDGCEPADGMATPLPDRDRSDGSTVTLISSRCPPPQEVLLYRVDGGGHRMPGLAPDAWLTRMVDAVLGRQNHDIDGPQVIWSFFARHNRE